MYLSLWITGGLIWVVASVIMVGRVGISQGRTTIALVVTVIATFLGARLHAVVWEMGVPVSQLWTQWRVVLRFTGMRLPGGLLLAGVTAPLALTLLRLPVAATIDESAPFVGLALAVGRIGCFLTGCCFGIVSSMPWAVRYRPGSPAFLNHAARSLIEFGAKASLPVHPFPLYLAVANLCICALAIWVKPRRRYVGEVGLVVVTAGAWTMVLLAPFRETTMETAVPFREGIPLVAGMLAAGCLLMGRMMTKRHAGVSPGDTEAVLHA